MVVHIPEEDTVPSTIHQSPSTTKKNDSDAMNGTTNDMTPETLPVADVTAEAETPPTAQDSLTSDALHAESVSESTPKRRADTSNDAIVIRQRTANLGAKDPGIALVAAVTDTTVRDICMRCKYPVSECDTLVKNCLFDSNVFIASKTLTCRACGEATEAEKHLITSMKRGPFTGMYIHQSCARAWYLANPMSAKPYELRYEMPSPDVAKFINSFVHALRANKIFHLDATAGAGKTNALVYAVDLCRQKNLSVVVLVFNTKAKEELYSRGLTAQECYNFHSYFMKAYQQWITATLQEHLIMSQDHGHKGRTYVTPTFCAIKIRLVLSMHLREHESPGVQAKYLRNYVSALADQARSHAFGAGGPENFDLEALHEISDKYNLPNHLTNAWNSVLTAPDKYTVERIMGSDDQKRVEYAIEITAQVLEKSLLCATSTEVDGQSSLYNDVTKENKKLPVIDHKDAGLVAEYMSLDLGRKHRVLIDEGQDADALQLSLGGRLALPNGRTLIVDDVGQSVYLWTGSERSQHEDFVRRAETLQLADNYRCGRAIIQEAQPFYDRMDRGLTIIPKRDNEGVVKTATFATEPINPTVRTLILGRATKHVVVFYGVLRSKGYRVQMHNASDSVNQLLGIIHLDKNCTLLERKVRLNKYLATHFPSQQADDTYELCEGIVVCIDQFLKEAPDGYDASTATSLAEFTKWLRAYFKDTVAGKDTSIVCATMHAAKGLEASDVYIINPSMSPLEDRLNLGGWQAYEELCVAFVARTRARDRLIYLPDLEATTRSEVLALFLDPNGGEDGGDLAEGSTDDTNIPASDQPSSNLLTEPGPSGPPGSEQYETAKALNTLRLNRMPDTKETVSNAVRALLLQSNGKAPITNPPPHQEVIKAAGHLKRVIDRKYVDH